MKLFLSAASVFACLLFSSVSIAQELIDQSRASEVLGVRLADLVRYDNPPQNLNSVNSYVEQYQEALFQTSGRVETLHIVTLRELPHRDQNREVYPLQAFVEYSSGRFVFENLTVTVDLQSRQLTYQRDGSIDLSQTNIEAEVGLIERILLITDESAGIRLSFPIGVGSFDESVLNEETSLLTPRFRTGYLSKRNVIRHRSRPRYFADKPFIRVLWGEQKDYTGIGFHAQPNLDPFIRAFDSHGCIRMQVADLVLFYHLVASNPATYIPISINYETQQEVDHPFPKRQNSYQRVQNVGSASNPMYTIDKDYLVQTTYRRGTPPTHLLRDFPEDDYQEYFNYSSETCRAKSFDREPRSGWSSWFTSTTAFQRCQPRERRNRLYRLWVHGRS